MQPFTREQRDDVCDIVTSLMMGLRFVLRRTKDEDLKSISLVLGEKGQRFLNEMRCQNIRK